MPSRFRITGGGTAVLFVLALFGVVAFVSVSRMSREQQSVVETNAGIASVQDLLVANYEADRSGLDYLRSGSAASADAFGAARSRIEDALDDLRSRAEDRPRQRAALDTLGQLIGSRLNDLSDAVNKRKRQTTAEVVSVVYSDTTREARNGVLPLIQRMREEELVVLAERTRLMAEKGRISRWVVLCGSIVAFLVAAVVLVPVRNETA